MKSMAQSRDVFIDPATIPVPVYRVVLAVPPEEFVEEQLRHVIRHKHGDLRSLCRAARRRMHVHLGVRRIDDVLAALEGAGFAIDAVVATTESPPA